MTNEELRKLAEAATPGPWIPAGPSFGAKLPQYYNCVCRDYEVEDGNEDDICGDMEHVDAEYIAAVSPDVVLSLLDRIKEYESREPVAWMADDGRVCNAATKETSMANASKPSFHIPLYLGVK